MLGCAGGTQALCLHACMCHGHASSSLLLPCAQVAGGGALPGWVLATFLANCMQDISSCVDPGRQSRHVKLLCACVALVLQRQPHALAESLPELLSFCIEVGFAAAGRRSRWGRRCAGRVAMRLLRTWRAGCERRPPCCAGRMRTWESPCCRHLPSEQRCFSLPAAIAAQAGG